MTSGTNPTHVIAIKSGSSEAGASAAASHTGALAGSDALYDAIFTMSGILRCKSVNELFDYAQAFAANKYPTGDNIAIITNAGGPGIIATDMSEQSGLKLAQFSDETIKELKKHLPSTANFNNPVDVIGDAAKDRYEKTLATVLTELLKDRSRISAMSEEAKTWADADPYVEAGVYASVTVKPFKKVFPN